VTKEGRRPLRYRSVRQTYSPPPLLIAVLFSVIAIYLDASTVLVALLAQRHFSGAAWVLIGSIAVTMSWIAVRAWRLIAANRHSRN